MFIQKSEQSDGSKRGDIPLNHFVEPQQVPLLTNFGKYFDRRRDGKHGSGQAEPGVVAWLRKAG